MTHETRQLLVAEKKHLFNRIHDQNAELLDSTRKIVKLETLVKNQTVGGAAQRDSILGLKRRLTASNNIAATWQEQVEDLEVTNKLLLAKHDTAQANLYDLRRKLHDIEEVLKR